MNCFIHFAVFYRKKIVVIKNTAPHEKTMKKLMIFLVALTVIFSISISTLCISEIQNFQQKFISANSAPCMLMFFYIYNYFYFFHKVKFVSCSKLNYNCEHYSFFLLPVILPT